MKALFTQITAGFKKERREPIKIVTKTTSDSFLDGTSPIGEAELRQATYHKEVGNQCLMTG